MKKEVIVGAVGLLVLVAVLWSVNKIRRSGILGRHFTLRVVTDDVYYLRRGQFVLRDGFQVGVVSDQEMAADGSGKYILTLSFTQPLALPDNTMARIGYVSVLGGRQITLVPDPNRKATGTLKDGDLIPGHKYDMARQAHEATAPLMAKVDSFLMKYPVDSIHRLYEDTKAGLAAFEAKTKSVHNSLVKQGPEMAKTIKEMEQMTARIRSKTPDYQAQLRSINKTLADLNAKNPKQKIEAATQQMRAINDTIVAKSAMIKQVNEGIDAASAKIDKIAKSPAMDKWVYQDSTADNVRTKATDAQLKVRDIYEHPEKYRKIKKSN